MNKLDIHISNFVIVAPAEEMKLVSTGYEVEKTKINYNYLSQKFKNRIHPENIDRLRFKRHSIFSLRKTSNSASFIVSYWACPGSPQLTGIELTTFVKFITKGI